MKQKLNTLLAATVAIAGPEALSDAMNQMDKGIKQIPAGTGKTKEITKSMVMNFINGTFTFVSTSYSGHNNTIYIRGQQAKDAELAVLKAFPKMPFKTESDTNLYSRKPGAKKYYFRANGEFVHTENASNIVFECMARDNRNAKRKFGNYVASLVKPASVTAQQSL